MEHSQSETQGSCGRAMVLAFLGGTVAGAVAAFLLAPQSGRQSREQLRGFAVRSRQSVRDMAHKVGEVCAEVITNAQKFPSVETGDQVARSAAEGETDKRVNHRNQVREEVM